MKKLIAVILLCLTLVSAAAAETLTTNGGYEVDYAHLPYQSEDAPSTVYYINEISPEALMKAYEALGVDLTGKVGVKMSTGESTRSNYLRPALIGDLIHAVNGTIVECNTAYGGSRASTAKHRQQACIDLVYAAPDSASLVRRIESRNGLHTLEHGDEIGLGSRYYRLEQIQ